MNNTIFELKNISKEYRTKVETIEILKNINFKLNQADLFQYKVNLEVVRQHC